MLAACSTYTPVFDDTSDMAHGQVMAATGDVTREQTRTREKFRSLRQVQPMGSSQRCQLHRRLISLSLAGVGPGGGSGGGGGNSGGSRGGSGSADYWDWEDAWERMPPNLRVSILAAGVQRRKGAGCLGGDSVHPTNRIRKRFVLCNYPTVAPLLYESLPSFLPFFVA